MILEAERSYAGRNGNDYEDSKRVNTIDNGRRSWERWEADANFGMELKRTEMQRLSSSKEPVKRFREPSDAQRKSD